MHPFAARVAGVVVSFALFASSAHAEEQTYFQQKAAEKLEELQSASGAAMRGLLLYPKDIRDSIRVYDVADGRGEGLDEVATGYPPEMTAAARTLVAERQVLGILSNNLILAGLPGDALEVYREKFNTQARQWFGTGKAQHDESLLRRVVRRAFLSSSGDDALVLLGEFAWERGEIAQARSFWEKDFPKILGIPLGMTAFSGKLLSPRSCGISSTRIAQLR